MKYEAGPIDAIKALIHKRKILNTQYKGKECREEPVFIPGDCVNVNKGGNDYTILNITDIHVADYALQAFLAFPAIKTVKKLVREIKPDLITVTGDIVCTKSDHYAIHRFTRMMESFGIPWAPVFGNHDDEGNCDLNYLADVMMSDCNCLMKKGSSEMRCGNYVIRILNNGSTALNLIMMDSGHGLVNEAQMKWFRSVTDNTEGECAVMMHIPLPQYQYALDDYNSSSDTDKKKFSFCGKCNEKICCARDKDGKPIDNGFFDILKESGRVRNVICGHEHMNNFSLLYQGIRLTYTMKVGKGSGYQPGFDGGTVIKVSDKGISSIIHLTRSMGKFRVLEKTDM